MDAHDLAACKFINLRQYNCLRTSVANGRFPWCFGAKDCHADSIYVPFNDYVSEIWGFFTCVLSRITY